MQSKTIWKLENGAGGSSADHTMTQIPDGMRIYQAKW
jgi:hypothetical protein